MIQDIIIKLLWTGWLLKIIVKCTDYILEIFLKISVTNFFAYVFFAEEAFSDCRNMKTILIVAIVAALAIAGRTEEAEANAEPAAPDMDFGAAADILDDDLMGFNPRRCYLSKCRYDGQLNLCRRGYYLSGRHCPNRLTFPRGNAYYNCCSLQRNP